METDIETQRDTLRETEIYIVREKQQRARKERERESER